VADRLRMADMPHGYEHLMRDVIERHQVWAYLIAVFSGLIAGWTSSLGDRVEECQSTRAIAATPVLLIAQLALLPLYLWLFVGSQFDLNLELGRHLLPAFVGLIVVPLILAFLTEKWAENSRKATGFIRFMGLMPVPMLTVVLFIITMTQVSQIDSTGLLIWLLMIVFPAYLLAVVLVGKALRRVFRLPVETARTVVFSLGTRNSFVVLPLALSMPEALAAAVVVIVVQSLVELFGMMLYLRWVPGRLLPDI
jgi:arsenite transporter